MSAYCNSAIKTANQVCNDYISISVWTGLLDPLVLALKNIEVYMYDADLQYYTKWTIRIIHRSQFQWQLIIIDGPNLRIRITAEHHMYCKWFFICSIVSVGGGNGRLSRKLHTNARFMCVKYESQYTKSPEY